MTIEELKSLKVGDMLTRPYNDGFSYHVEIIGKTGIVVNEKWKNDFGTFCESRYIPNEDLTLEQWEVFK